MHSGFASFNLVFRNFISEIATLAISIINNIFKNIPLHQGFGHSRRPAWIAAAGD